MFFYTVFMIKLKVIEATFPKQISICLTIRKEVFIEEQKVPENEELDDFDSISFHALAYLDSTPIATGRLINITESHMKIGRMAVIKQYRKNGYGKKVLNFLEKKAIELGAKKIILNSQEYVKDFYINLGYLEKGNIFLEAGIPHIKMYKNI